ncbi:MAG: hypothetical protein IPJ19_09075 [Planctomycetes bacterium]|nr:hypothetical protein [Planctomycetota bacterium]
MACCRNARSRPVPPALFWSVALLLRAAALASGPVYSDDIQRYAWEGEVALGGSSPYAFAPDAPELASLREALPELAPRVAHAEVPAVYPPLAQACGLATAALVHASGASPGPANVWILRVLFLAADLGVLAVLLRARKAGRLRSEAPLVWGWCPLVCLEFAGSGHLDSLGILFLLLALLACEARPLASALWCGLGASVKLLPLCVLPWIGRERPPARRLLFALLALGILAAGYLPFLQLAGGERGLGAGLHEYGERWEAASLVYRFVEPWVLEHYGQGVPFEETRHLARVGVGWVWIAICLVAVWRRRDAWSGAGAVVGAFLVLSPTLHPWYTLWMLPFLLERPSLAWSWLVAVSAIFYWPLAAWKAQQQWIEPAWAWWLVAPVFAALWICERWCARGLAGARA